MSEHEHETSHPGDEGHDDPGHDDPGHDDPGHDDHDGPGHDGPGHDDPGHDGPGHDDPGHDGRDKPPPGGGHDDSGHSGPGDPPPPGGDDGGTGQHLDPPPPDSSSPLGKAANEFADISDNRDTKIDRFFPSDSDVLGADFTKFKDARISDMKTQLLNDPGPGVDWVGDGYAALVANMPDVAPALDAWQAQKEKDPFDKESLADAATGVKDALNAFWAYLKTPGFKSQAVMSLQGAVESVAHAMEAQTRALDDPATFACGGLDDFQKDPVTVSSTVSNYIDEQAKSMKSEAKFWSAEKKQWTAQVSSGDKALSKQVSSALSDVDKQIARWDKLTQTKKTVKGYPTIETTRDVATALADADTKLSALYQSAPNRDAANGVAALRQTLRVLALNVSKTTKFLIVNH